MVDVFIKALKKQTRVFHWVSLGHLREEAVHF